MGLEDRCLELLVLAQPFPLSTFNLDEAIAESLRAEAEFRRYNASATALTVLNQTDLLNSPLT